MAMLRRPRPAGGRHPPPLAPTVSNFKPRAQWSDSGSSIFLYVNLPGFYRDQIEIKKDERTRTFQIQGQRPLSAQTKARFSEIYRVPESCDMTRLNTSFSHGLLTIEFPAVVEGEKPEKAVHDQGKTVQRPNHEESRGPAINGVSLGRKKPSDKEKQVGTSQEKAAPMANKEEPKTYKSVVEGKRVAPTANREKTEQKVKEGEASPSLRRKEHAKEEKVVERKEAAQLGQQKLKEEGITRTPAIGGSFGPKVHAKAEKVVERKGAGEIGQKPKEEGKIDLRQKKEEKHAKHIVGDEGARTEKEFHATDQAAPELKMRESVERIGNANVKSKHDKKDEKTVEDKVSEREVHWRVKQKKIEEANLAKETGNVKDNSEVMEPRRVDSGDPLKEETIQRSGDKEKIAEKSPKSQTSPFLVEGQKETNMDPPAIGGIGVDEQETQNYDISLVNVGVASLVIMGFGAYVFVPLVKMFY